VVTIFYSNLAGMNNVSKPLQGPAFTPPFLKQGSVIGITCPSGYVPEERITYSVEVLERWGFKVKQGKTIGTEFNYFSGTDEQRAADLQAMLDDPGIEAILMGRGGYGMSRIIDDLNFKAFLHRPKWICGFSDITVLQSHLQARFFMPSLHSPMCGAFKPETENTDYLKTFYAALTGESIYYHTPATPFNRKGEAEAVLTGGNLSLLTHLIGSASEVDTEDKILFIEDIGEHLYKIDRMLLTLKRAGKLDHIKGLLVGGFTEMEDTGRPFGQTVEEIIRDKVKEYDYPVCFNFPAGHQDINYTITLGATHKLTVNGNGGTLELKRGL
jgi:muramoyltetrapeptide carboxypeptidase